MTGCDPGSRVHLEAGDSLRLAAGLQEGFATAWVTPLLRVPTTFSWKARPGSRPPSCPWPGTHGHSTPPRRRASGTGGARVRPSSWRREPVRALGPRSRALKASGARLPHADCGTPFPPGLTVHRPASLIITADRPFRYETAVFSNLGNLVRDSPEKSARGILQSSGGAGAPVAQDPSRALYQVRCSGMGARSTDPKRAPAPISGERMRRCRQRWPQATSPFGEEFADHSLLRRD